jgi:hypothetical protein
MAAIVAILLFGAPGAKAAVTEGSCGALTTNGEMIDGSGDAVQVIGFGATSDTDSTDSLMMVYVDFSGTGFTTDDLAALSTDSSASGVGLYRDDGTVDDAYDSSDTALTLFDNAWSGSEAQMTFDTGYEYVPTAITGNYEWIIVIRVSGTVSDGDQIDTTLYEGNIEFDDTTTMPTGADVTADTITVDTNAPDSWAGIDPSGWYTTDQAPTVTITVQDTESGLAVLTGLYEYSIDGGATWSAPIAASVTGSDGSTDVETMTATSVPFSQDSADQNIIEFQITDMVGNIGDSGSYIIQIDTNAPQYMDDLSPSGWYSADQQPTVTISVSDATSGLDTASPYYEYSIDGGFSWSGWIAASVSGIDGSTGIETITAANVPFGQDSIDQNMIEFEISDMAGLTATSPSFTIMIDTIVPDNWNNIAPTGWFTASQEPDVTIEVQDDTSGLDTLSAQYQFSIDGGGSWSGWIGATVTGSDGSTNIETITAAAVPFDQDSLDQNLIEFEINDMAGNTGDSGSYTIMIDANAPDSWANLVPAGWYMTSQTPDVSIDVQDTGSGLDTANVYYGYSTDGGLNWNGPFLASVTGGDGSTLVETITASAVQFNQDSGTLNLIKFGIMDLAGNLGISNEYIILIDTNVPDSWAGIDPSGWYTASQEPDVTITVQDTDSGLDTATANYQYSTDGGATWSGWLGATVSGSDGSTDVETITASAVPFDQDSSDQNQIQFEISDVAGNTGTSTAYTIMIDTAAPDDWANLVPSGWYTADQAPDVTIDVQDLTSGLSVASATYSFSTDGGGSWSLWLAASVTGSDGSTGVETITAAAVPFNQDSGTENQIVFEIMDLAGNTGDSGSYTIQIETVGPDSWANLVPAGWYTASQTPDVTIDVQDTGSGIDTATANYQYSTDGGLTWNGPFAATVTGSDGSTAVETITASAVPFYQDSGDQNQIQFMIDDMAGNTGTSGIYTVQIDINAPDNWANLVPSDWYSASQEPDVTIDVQDDTSGLDTMSAYYEYSIDGGLTWSGLIGASVSGIDGSTVVETITAAAVPFDQDSGTLNMIHFQIGDMAGNSVISSDYTIQIDSMAPDSWANLVPSGWYTADQTPDVTIDVQDTGTGLDTTSAYYSYSTDGGSNWNGPFLASVTGIDGSTGVETITAAAVPFNQDSGTQNLIEFTIMDMAGNTGDSGPYTIQIDAFGPDTWANFFPTDWYIMSQWPYSTIDVQDTGSGIDTTTAQYSYSTDGGTTWSAYTSLYTSVTGVDGSTSVETITAGSIPFLQDSADQNMIQFQLSDENGNVGTSGQYIIMVDTSLPDNYDNLVPSDWYTLSQEPDVSIDVQDFTSGLDTATAEYEFSIDQHDSWSAWFPATVTGSDGSTVVETITAAAVPFDQDSATLNYIRFRITDMAGNTGESDEYLIMIDANGPDNWASLSPSGWYTASQEPDVTIQVQDTASGIDIATAYYSYSTNGGADWSAWTAASITGIDGSTGVETITASAVPFDQDSADQNLIQFELNDKLGNTGTSDTYTIEIDTNTPGGWANVNPSGWYSASQEPDVSIDVQDVTSGLDVESAYYSYSTDGGMSWSDWYWADVTGDFGSTGVETITAYAVEFDQDSGTLNQIQFEITDMAGNTGTSGIYTILIDTIAPDSWANIVPSGWYTASQEPDVTIDVQDTGTGLDTASAYYSFTTDGGTTWSGWLAASVTGIDGSTGVETITASAVPFDQDSGTLNQIQFEINDVAGNTGMSGVYTIQIETTGPDSWTNLVPSGWYNTDQEPTVTIDVQDTGMGIDTTTAYYQYSTDGGATWSGWISTTVTGVDGSTNVETITAANVPFDQDSADQNQIQFELDDMNGNNGMSGIYTIQIDTNVPDSWANINPSGWYMASQEPDVTIDVQDSTSGLDTTSAVYEYSIDGGLTWSGWFMASVTGGDGSTAVETITATAVPFDQDSGTQNMIQFEIMDMAGNTGDSGPYTIMVDAFGPDSWANVNPSGWYAASQTPDVTIDVQDTGSGIDTATAYYQYSTDGGASWSGWISTTVSGIDGSTGVETITASAVPFNQDSADQNMIQFQLSDMNGNVGTSDTYTIKIDTTMPDSWNNLDPSGWSIASQEPDVSIDVQDTDSGLNTASAYYSYSTDGGSTWSLWLPASCTGSDGSTDVETITASAVPFDQDSADQNQIQFEITDMAGNTGTSDVYTIQIDTLAPGSWANIDPSGWYTLSQEPDVTIDVQDVTSGISTASAFFQYSTDGGMSWSGLIGATVTGVDGSNNVETITAFAVPFDQDSGTLNQIEFEIMDMAGNTGMSGPFTIMIETTGPDNWANLVPSGWYNADQQPTVTIDVQDTGMGIDTATAYYQYSTDGGATWSGWIATTVTGVDGSTNVETITAATVPFDQDSADQNQIQFQLTDMNGNVGTSLVYTIQIDTAAPYNWNNIDPAGLYTASQEPDVTIEVQDDTSGLDTASAYYSYSIDGGLTWSAWLSASVSGFDGSTVVETVTASSVPFDQDSLTQNMIQFEISDMAGLQSTSGTYTIQIDANGPDSWANLAPSGWYTADQEPTVTIDVQDSVTGIDTATAYYQYSTNGGIDWSGWLAASVSGVDGSTNVETITAGPVPFDQDSADMNLIQFELNDMAGNTGISPAYTILIDTLSPDSWNNIDPAGWYTASQAPDVTIEVQDLGSGLDTATAEYQYSTDGGDSWSGWLAATVSGSDGSTNVETITAAAVPFDQDSSDQNLIQFEINDMLGNTGISGTYTIQIDTSIPDSWNNIDPSGWYSASQTPDVTIEVQDSTSGLDTATANYRFSTDGGTSWSEWTAATVTGGDGSNNVETITATAVPFNQDSGTQNLIEFEIMDMAGNTGDSGSYTIQIETVGPDNWANINPSGWYTSDQQPTVTIDVQDTGSGIDTATAYYQYSTDGGNSWNGWFPASVSGVDGSTSVETITAGPVPFDQDSADMNLIQFELNDMAGNTGMSGIYTIQIDTNTPDSWANVNPSGWYTASQMPDVTIDVQDLTSGLDTASANYEYSIDGGMSWSGWIGASVSGFDGSTGVETITASGVPFFQDSGTQNMIHFQISDMAGNSAMSGDYTIQIDTQAPDSWNNIDPSGWYTASQTPDVTIDVQDTESGIDTATASYQYSTDGGASWSGWIPASVTGGDGSTNTETITASSVPFNQDSGTQNLIEFSLTDLAGNTGYSGSYTIQIETVGPDSWNNINPSGWYTASQTPTVTISVQDTSSGLDVSTGYYRYSTDGGSTWSSWTSASVTGSDGTTRVQTLTATAVPFNQDSASQNLIEFELNDMAGNTGSSPSYTIQIDTKSPGGWNGISPTGWVTASQTPTVTISVQDSISGLDVSDAQYSYSTDGGASWSAWASASVTGKDGTTVAQTMTATAVPFNQDSGTRDQIMFRMTDIAGLTGTSAAYTIMIDTATPGSWAGIDPGDWFTASQAPTVTVNVQDVTSGLHVSTAVYQFSTDGGTTWSAWTPATMTGTDGTVAVQTITAANVPFNQDSGTQNVIQFSVMDMAGLTGTSPAYVIKIDTATPGGWAGIAPSGWYNTSQTPTVSVTVQDATSGLNVSAAQYRYSTDGGLTWSAWTAAATTGTAGTTAPQTVTAANVPFDQDSGTFNQIEFMIPDLAGNIGTSQAYTIMIDSNSPGGWAGLAPSGWYNASRSPTVTVTVQDVGSGLLVASAQYQYSTNGGTTWSAWAGATVTGTDGTTQTQTITAANVPFGADSGTLNKIRFRIADIAGNTGTSPDYTIKIDTQSPGTWSGLTPSGWYNLSNAPTVTVTVSDAAAGLNASAASYRFSTDGGATWSAWTPATVSGANGTTAPQVITAAAVPFDQDSASLNMIRFRITDMAGNTGTSADYTIQIDTAAPGNWTGVSPAGWFTLSRTPTLTVQGSDDLSGLNTTSAVYQFSTDGGVTWSDWSPATVTGTDGTTILQTLTAPSVPFNQESANRNMIRFRILDLAGNAGTSADYTIQIDTAAPGNWVGITPTGWYNSSKTPNVTVQASDLLSGLNITSAQYQFSTDGGATWSNWTPATVTGTAGTTAPQTITAANVPFNADSASNNRIRFRISDLAGNVGASADYTIRIDTTPPASSLQPLPKYSNTTTLHLNFSASDNGSGLAKLELWYRVNGGAYQQFPGNLTTSPLTFEAASDGLYEFYLRGLDNAGNYRPVPATPDANTTVKTHMTEPVIKIKEGSETTESKVHITGTVEPGSTVQVNGKDVPVDAGGHFAATVPLSDGANKIHVTVTDPAGNTKTIDKTVTKKAPSSMMIWLLLVLVIIILALAGAALAMRGRGKKPAAAAVSGPAPEGEEEPLEAEEVTDEGEAEAGEGAGDDEEGAPEEEETGDREEGAQDEGEEPAEEEEEPAGKEDEES